MAIGRANDPAMSRRSQRVRARFAATVQIGGVDHTLICHTRDISHEGCFLETSEQIACGVGVALSVMDNERGQVVSVNGVITRIGDGDGDDRGVGVRLIDASNDWQILVHRFREAREIDKVRPNLRLNILVVSSEHNRRGALALYVTSGWDIRFATDTATATEALRGPRLDAIICELDVKDDEWPAILNVAQAVQSQARRLVRCKVRDQDLPTSGSDQLVHRFVDVENGMDALLDALTAELGELRTAMTDPQTGALPLSETAASELLREILTTVKADDQSIIVFDLDSTLLNNGPRQSAILAEYGKEVKIVELQNSKPEHWQSWDVGEAMANSGLDAARLEEHQEPFKDYWRERFFTSEYCKLDEMIDGAADFVQAVRDADGKVYYVTGRHEEMRAGTVECLQRLGFPVPDERDVCLIMKPTMQENDDAYKLRTYGELAAHGLVVAAFDNEPTHINGYHEAFPSAYSVHLATDHSGRAVKVSDGILSIRHFSAVDE